MMKRYVALTAAVIMMSLTACGTFAPPQATETAITTTMTETTTVPLVTTVPEDSSGSEVTTKVTMSEEEKKQLATNTFIAEFYDSPISFDDMSKTVSEVMKKSGFENTVKSANGVQKITVKADNGGGVIDVMAIDISACDFSYDQEYIAEAFGAYCYGQTVGSMQGVTEDNFVSNCRMINTVVAKAKYQQYGSVQKSDGTATQFGYAETAAVLVDNKLTVVSGQFLSTDMMERQTFTKLITSFKEKLQF